jgi:hypothetical protein
VKKLLGHDRPFPVLRDGQPTPPAPVRLAPLSVLMLVQLQGHRSFQPTQLRRRSDGYGLFVHTWALQKEMSGTITISISSGEVALDTLSQ